MKKFDVSLKQIVSNNLGNLNGQHIFTGSKVTSVVAMDPIDGHILGTFGDPDKIVETNQMTKDAIYLSHTEYSLNIWCINTKKLLWNISYTEYESTGNGLSDQMSDYFSTQFLADVDGGFSVSSHGREPALKTEFSSPVISAFDITTSDNGDGTSFLSKSYGALPSSKSQDNGAYIGNLDGTFYLLSDKNFPFIQKEKAELNSYTVDEECITGSANFPDCLVGMHELESPRSCFIDEEILQVNGFGLFVKTIAITLLLSVFTALSLLMRKLILKRNPILPDYRLIGATEEKHSESPKTLEQDDVSRLQSTSQSTDLKEIVSGTPVEDEPSSLSTTSSSKLYPTTTSNSLKSISVSENVLGYGSHGTVVLEGLFEGRPVAIKRMLADFYEVADHEVKLLQQSDQHPNVVRYYFKETCEGFTYIALEQAAGSMCDLIARKDIEELHLVHKEMELKTIFQQTMLGISHLHSLNIVHRDIKPQNILISFAKKTRSKHKGSLPRILISDFGLGKRLADDQSSFHNTILPGGGTAGTVGWRAPECLAMQMTGSSSSSDNSHGWVEAGRKKSDNKESSNNPVRITKAIDIFSVGCVFYYIASFGHHPFGERFSREANILKGNFRIQHLDSLPDANLLKDLIKRMISKDHRKRPTAEMVLKHPYFWSATKQLSFLQDLSDRLEIESKEPLSATLKSLERLSNKTFGADWQRKFNRTVLDNMMKFRKYDGSSLQDLLRAIRNKVSHSFN
ncbi:kinase-like domain-containing protein [Globomyces pollinis-pini]|nr:kinase-like domain-containing protein [Globomyces pollinis-pini]